MKKKIIPIAVAVGLMIVVVLIGLATGVWEKYSYSHEKADPNEYFGITGGEETAIILNDEIVETDAYDRKGAKELLKKLASESDVVSNHIDRIKVNTIVNFTPSYNVNDTFDDAMNEYLAK